MKKTPYIEKTTLVYLAMQGVAESALSHTLTNKIPPTSQTGISMRGRKAYNEIRVPHTLLLYHRIRF